MTISYDFFAYDGDMHTMDNSFDRISFSNLWIMNSTLLEMHPREKQAFYFGLVTSYDILSDNLSK